MTMFTAKRRRALVKMGASANRRIAGRPLSEERIQREFIPHAKTMLYNDKMRRTASANACLPRQMEALRKSQPAVFLLEQITTEARGDVHANRHSGPHRLADAAAPIRPVGAGLRQSGGRTCGTRP